MKKKTLILLGGPLITITPIVSMVSCGEKKIAERDEFISLSSELSMDTVKTKNGVEYSVIPWSSKNRHEKFVQYDTRHSTAIMLYGAVHKGNLYVFKFSNAEERKDYEIAQDIKELVPFYNREKWVNPSNVENVKTVVYNTDINTIVKTIWGEGASYLRKVLSSLESEYLTNKSNLLPEQLRNGAQGLEVSANYLGLEELVDDLEIQTTFNITDYDNTNGALKVEVNLSFSDVVLSKTIVITGYKTNVLQDVDSIMEQIRDVRVSNKNNILPSKLVVIGEQIDPQMFGLSKPNAIYDSIKYEVTNVNDEIGEISVKVELMIDGHAHVKYITYTGFATSYTSQIQNIASRIESEYNTLRKDKHINDFSVHQVVTPVDLGILPFNFDGATFRYAVYSVNDYSGEVSINLQIEMNKTTSSTRFTVSGFVTQYQEQVRAAFSYLQNNITLTPYRLTFADDSFKINTPYIDWREINVNDPLNNYYYSGYGNILLSKLIVKEINKHTGTIRVDVYLKSRYGSYEESREFTISGYQTLAEKTQMIFDGLSHDDEVETFKYNLSTVKNSSSISKSFISDILEIDPSNFSFTFISNEDNKLKFDVKYNSNNKTLTIDYAAKESYDSLRDATTPYDFSNTQPTDADIARLLHIHQNVKYFWANNISERKIIVVASLTSIDSKVITIKY